MRAHARDRTHRRVPVGHRHNVNMVHIGEMRYSRTGTVLCAPSLLMYCIMNRSSFSGFQRGALSSSGMLVRTLILRLGSNRGIVLSAGPKPNNWFGRGKRPNHNEVYGSGRQNSEISGISVFP